MNSNRTSRILAGACAVALVAALGWRWLVASPAANADGATAPPRSPGASVAGVAPAPSAAASGASPMLKSTPVQTAEDPRCIIRSAPSPAVVDAGTTDESPVGSSTGTPMDAAREDMLQRLRASSDPYANAVAVWLDVAPGDDARRAARDRQLAAMAASTRDPRLYALALRACWHRPGHECQALSARRWSELEPDNAMPWLLMLDEAVLQKDESGVHEALYHATHARRLAERAQAPVQAIVDAATDDPGSLVAARSMAIEAIGLSAAEVGPIGYTACRAATPADANIWQQCTALVDLLEHRSDSFYARTVGAAIDKRLTGNAEPAKQVAAQMAQLMALDLASSSSCTDLRGKLSLMRRMAVEGEVAVARGPRP